MWLCFAILLIVTSLNSATCFGENIEKTLEPLRLALRLPREDVLSAAAAGAAAAGASSAAGAPSSLVLFFFLIFFSLSAWNNLFLYLFYYKLHFIFYFVEFLR